MQTFQQQFSFSELFNGHIDILGDIENPIFILNQICEKLKISRTSDMIIEILKNNSFLSFVENEEQNHKFLLNKYHNKIPSLINEDGLYEILCRSKKPLAHEFRRKISSLLKNIRLGNLREKNEHIKKLDILIINQEKNHKEQINKSNEIIQQSKQQYLNLKNSMNQILNKERVLDTNLNELKEEFIVVKNNDNSYYIGRVQNRSKKQNEKIIDEQIIYRINVSSAIKFFNYLCERLQNNLFVKKRNDIKLINDNTEQDLIDNINSLHQERYDL